MSSASPAIDADIDVTKDLCPMTYVRTRMALDRLLPGQRLRVTLCGAEARQNVPATARLQGHQILSETLLDAGRWEVIIRKQQGSAST